MYIFEISMKDGFFDIQFNLIKEKKFSTHNKGSVCTFYELRSPKWKQPLNISENSVLLTGLRISSPF
jgi:hypothetical protein